MSYTLGDIVRILGGWSVCAVWTDSDRRPSAGVDLKRKTGQRLRWVDTDVLSGRRWSEIGDIVEVTGRWVVVAVWDDDGVGLVREGGRQWLRWVDGAIPEKEGAP